MLDAFLLLLGILVLLGNKRGRPRNNNNQGRGRPANTGSNRHTLTRRTENAAARERMARINEHQRLQQQQRENQLNNSNTHLSENSTYNLQEMKQLDKAFHQKLGEEHYEFCNNCGHRFFGLKVNSNGECSKCCSNRSNINHKKFTAENHMDPGPVPHCLQILTPLEQLLIARVHPQLYVYKLSGGQLGYKGHVINFHQDVQQFASVLPHKISSLSNLIIVKSENVKGVAEFKVNKKRLLDALHYLQKNNKYYQQINIEINNLHDQPIEQDEIDGLDYLPNNAVADSHQEIEEDEINTLIHSDVPNILISNNRQQVNSAFGFAPSDENIINFPTLSESPVNEFDTAGFIVMAFPSLFPTGEADFKQARRTTVTLKEYFEHLMLYDDRRFARDPRFRYFGLNMLMRHQTISNSRICVRKSKLQTMSFEELKQKLRTDKGFITNLMSYNQNIRGTSNYWFQRSRELLSMVDTLGAPTLFFTLSAADLFWPEIFKKIDPSYQTENTTDREILQHRRKLLNNNPMEFAYFFNRRAEIFAEKVLKVKFEVEDYWYRHEFQHRGSPHIHGLLWLKNSPDICDLNLNSNEPSELDDIAFTVEYFDNLVSTQNPDASVEYDRNPCTKTFAEIANNEHLNDYVQLINYCQRHTRHTPYCLKKNTKVCRFGYPKELVDHSHLKINKKTNQLEFVSKRNDELMNSHNRVITELWRANTDVQSIISVYAVLHYIAKYTTKNECRSSVFQDFIKLLLDGNAGLQLSAHQIVTKMLMKFLVERDYSAQETCYFLMGYKYYSSSRMFKTIYLSLEEDEFQEIDLRKASKNQPQSNTNATNDSSSIRQTNLSELGVSRINYIEEYQQRPDIYEDWNLKRYFATIYKSNGELKARTACHEFILRIVPEILQNAELNAKREIVVNYPYRNLNDVFNQSWSQTLRDLESANATNQVSENLNEQLHSVIDDIRDSPDTIEFEPNREFNEYMLASAAGPNQQLHHLNIGLRDMDILEHDWAGHSLPDAEIENLHTFANSLNQASVETSYPPVRVILNPQQQTVFAFFLQQLLNVQNNNVLPAMLKLCLVQGVAGSGKSTL